MAIGGEQRDGGTLGREGKEGGTWRREGGGAGTMERERHRRSLARDGSLGRHCDLHGAELVQVAERQLSQIQHVHGYVTHSHITPAQVTGCRWLPAAAYMWRARLFASGVGSVFGNTLAHDSGRGRCVVSASPTTSALFCKRLQTSGSRCSCHSSWGMFNWDFCFGKEPVNCSSGKFTSYVTKSERCLSFLLCWFQGRF